MKKQELLEVEQEEYQLKTKHGYNFDEVASALQKSIRRGMEREAAFWGVELFNSYWKYVFNRLVVIAAEDIDDPQILQTVVSTAIWVNELKKPPDVVVVVKLILMIVRARKNREADELANLVLMDMEEGKLLEMPDWAVDKHTKRGKALGRDLKFFWEEGAKLENPLPSKYRDELYKRLGYKKPE